MSKKLTFNLIDIYTDINTFISQMILVVNEMLDENYILPTEFGVYIFTPIWRRFKNSNACFENSEEGIASFKDNFTNQIQEIGFDFFSWCKANIEYFKTITDETNKNKSFSKQLNTGIYPVNENLQQTASQTQFATGTTNQNIVEIISNGIGWYKASQQFMTPQKKNDMLNSFKWLFIKYSNATKNEYTVLEIDKTGLIPVGDADYVEIVDDNLKSENIIPGVKILGIEGSAPPTPTEEKTVNITKNGTTVVRPTAGSNLSKVTINTIVETIEYIPLKLLFYYRPKNVTGFSVLSDFIVTLQITLLQLQDSYGCVFQKLDLSTGEYENITITNNTVSELYVNNLDNATDKHFYFKQSENIPQYQILVPLYAYNVQVLYFKIGICAYLGETGGDYLIIAPFKRGTFNNTAVDTGVGIGLGVRN